MVSPMCMSSSYGIVAYTHPTRGMVRVVMIIAICMSIISAEQWKAVQGIQGRVNCRGATPEQAPLGVPTPTRKWGVLLYQHWIPGLRVHLNPAAGVVQHRNAVLIVHLHGARVRQRLLKRPMVMGYSQGALADHVGVGQQFLFAPL